MDIFQAIEKRYSHKGGFLPDPVPLEKLAAIAKAGLAAPTAMNSQCVRLVILPDRAALEPLCDVFPTKGLLTAPAAIAVLTESSKQKSVHNFELEDYSAAAENMLLAVTALGYVSLWLDSPYFSEEKQKAALAALGAPEGYRLRVVLPVGLAGEPGTNPAKIPFDELISYGSFGKSRCGGK